METYKTFAVTYTAKNGCRTQKHFNSTASRDAWIARVGGTDCRYYEGEKVRKPRPRRAA